MKRLKEIGKSLDEHPSKHQQHPPGGPGSPDAGSHAVSKRNDHIALAPRGSPPASRTPSPSSSKEKSPAHDAHDTQSVRLFGVNISPGEKAAGEPHRGRSGSSSAANPAKSGPSQTKQPGNLGHLIAGLHPKGQKPRERKGRFMKPPGESSESRNILQPITQSSHLRGKGRGNRSNHRKGPWWKHAGGTPRAQDGQGRLYLYQKQYREKKKLRLEGKSVDEHPSGPRHHPTDGGGPGSPGAGSHAISKRGVDGELSPRGSGSDPKSTSSSDSKEKRPPHGTHSTRLFGVNVHQGGSRSPPRHDTHSTRLFGVNVAPGRPASPSQPSRAALSQHTVHPAHPTLNQAGNKFRDEASASHSEGKKAAGRLGHLVAGLRPVRWRAQLSLSGKPVGARREIKRPRESKTGSASQEVTKASNRPKKVSGRTPWWKKPGGVPPSERVPDGTSRRAEGQRRYREKKKFKAVGLPADDHPSQHGKRPSGGPGSPGADGHAVSKRNVQGPIH